MPLSTEIKLPKSVTPVFPRRCVFSGIENPDTVAVLIPTSTFATFGLLLYPLLCLFGCRPVRMPIMRQYWLSFYVQQIARDLVAFALPTLMPCFAHFYYQSMESIYGGFILGICTWVGLEMYYPRSISVTKNKLFIDYSFASNPYAKEFRVLNAPLHASLE